MTNFKKYQSIENYYNSKYLKKLPESVKSQPFAVSEKLDGANISLIFTKDNPVTLARRTDFIKEGEKFNDIQHILLSYQDQLSFFQALANESGREYRLYGEIYGEGINGRIDYGKGKKIAIFDMEVDGKLWSVAGIYNLIEHNIDLLMHFFVPQGCVNNLAEALAIDVEGKNEAGRLLAEGIVIKPFYENYFDKAGKRLIIKKKAEAFNDIEGSSGPKPQKELPPLVAELNGIFYGFINENRMLDCFSKHGEIQSPKEIGSFLKLILEDAKEDFLKLHGDRLKELEKPEHERMVYNVGSAIAMLLQAHLKDA